MSALRRRRYGWEAPSRLGLGVLLLLGLGACGDAAGPATPGARGPRRATPGAGAGSGHRVVARVDGVPIEAAEVSALARELGVAPRRALDRLIEQELLAAAAERRGLGRDPVVRDEVRRSAARVLLEREVGRLRPSDVPAAMVGRAYEENPRRFDAPELRTVAHVLVKFAAHRSPASDERARRVAEALRAEVADFVEPTEMIPLNGTTRDGMSLVVERVERFAPGDAYEPAFIAASFALAAPGDVSPPVRTSFGWHVIRLMEIHPPLSTPAARRDATLRRELLPQYREQRTQELLRDLAGTIGTSRDAAVIGVALARDPLGEQGDDGASP